MLHFPRGHLTSGKKINIKSWEEVFHLIQWQTFGKISAVIGGRNLKQLASFQKELKGYRTNYKT